MSSIKCFLTFSLYHAMKNSAIGKIKSFPLFFLHMAMISSFGLEWFLRPNRCHVIDSTVTGTSCIRPSQAVGNNWKPWPTGSAHGKLYHRIKPVFLTGKLYHAVLFFLEMVNFTFSSFSVFSIFWEFHIFQFFQIFPFSTISRMVNSTNFQFPDSDISL